MGVQSCLLLLVFGWLRSKMGGSCLLDHDSKIYLSSVSASLCVSLRLSVSASLCVSLSLRLCLSASLSLSLRLSLSLCVSLSLSASLSLCVSLSLSASLSLSLCVSVSLSLCVSGYLTNDLMDRADWLNDFCMMIVIKKFSFDHQSTLYLWHLLDVHCSCT